MNRKVNYSQKGGCGALGKGCNAFLVIGSLYSITEQAP